VEMWEVLRRYLTHSNHSVNEDNFITVLMTILIVW
jgi:hypothetical protein